MINEGNKFIHWNHFLALEKDLETISRYVELTKDNDSTYSIELAKLLFAASSETDVVMKELCKLLAPEKEVGGMKDYCELIKEKLPNLIEEKVFIDRFGLDYQPFLNWKDCEEMFWWNAYNGVKHHRSEDYSKANLKNTLNALGALLITTTYFYKKKFEKEQGKDVNFKITNNKLNQNPTLLLLRNEYYYNYYVS